MRTYNSPVILIAVLFSISNELCLAKKKLDLPYFTYIDQSEYGPDKWAELWKTCNGTRQSPIVVNLDSNQSKRVDWPEMMWSDCYNATPKNLYFSIWNHTFSIRPEYEDDQVPTLRNGPLTNVFALQRIIFRWGSKNGQGSEHRPSEDRAMEMEIQAIHTNIRYETFDIQTAQGDGMVIVYYYVEVSDSMHDELFDNIIDNLKAMGPNGEEGAIPEPFPINFLLPKNPAVYGFYRGSMTFPPCAECVQWIVTDKKPFQITTSQLRAFRSLYVKDQFLKDNFRPLQETNLDVYTTN